jgi:hypothetical protein
MANLSTYLIKPSYKYVVRSLLEFFKEDIEAITNQFLIYGINEISEVSQIMPQGSTPGFGSFPNREVYVFTIDIQTPVAPPKIFSIICDTLCHNFISTMIVHGYDEPIESAYRMQVATNDLDNAAKKDGLTQASLSVITDDEAKRDFIDAMTGMNQLAAVVSGACNSNNFRSDFPQNQTGLMKPALDAQNKLTIVKPDNANKDAKFIIKYTAPTRKLSDQVDKWYVDQEFKLTKRSS